MNQMEWIGGVKRMKTVEIKKTAEISQSRLNRNQRMTFPVRATKIQINSELRTKTINLFKFN